MSASLTKVRWYLVVILDGYNSYAQRGNLPLIEDVVEGGYGYMPMIGGTID